MLNKYKTILQLLSDGNYHSSADLGTKLKLTRGTIRKIIKQLKKYDIDVITKTKLGYKIHEGLELLNLENISSCISHENIKYINQIEIFDELNSTNNYLVDKIIKRKKPTTGSQLKTDICLAEYQTNGKGRLGRAWLSPFARNIYLSLSWQFTCPSQDLSNLSLAIAIAVVDALNKYGIKENITLKWPNDVLWNGHKLAGILIDLFGETHNTYNTVIGIGLNVNMPRKLGKKITQNWCDVAQIINTKPKRNKLTGILLDQLLNTIITYQKHGLKPLLKKWHKLDATYGKKVTIITPQQRYTGISLGIDNKGYFLLKDNTNKTLAFASGDVSIRF